MKKHFLVILIITISIIGCKDDKKATEDKKEEVVNNQFKVTLNLLIKKNDTIHVYYTEDNTSNFNEESSIWTPVSGKDVAQDVVVELPKDVFPTQFRIDLGVNRENEKVGLKGIKFNYLKKEFDINEKSIYTYFRVNTDNSILDPVTNELSRKDPKVAAGACLYPLEIPLKTEIDKLAK